MTVNDVLQTLLYLAVLLALTNPLGVYMARVYEGERTLLDPVLGPLERFLYRAAGVRADEGMTWKTYTLAMLVFNALSLLVVYVMQRVQGWLPRRASPRERALRARPGCLPGCLAGQAGTPGSRRGRHGLPRRGRRVTSRAPGEAAPLPRGAPIRAGRRQRDDHREHADHRRNQPRPRGRGPRGALS